MTMLKLAAMTAVSVAVVSGAAMAQGVDIKLGVGIPLSPGQQGTSPGQVYNTTRADPTTSATALPPGKLFLLNQSQATDPTTVLPPGQTFTNNGRINNQRKK